MVARTAVAEHGLLVSVCVFVSTALFVTILDTILDDGAGFEDGVGRSRVLC